MPGLANVPDQVYASRLLLVTFNSFVLSHATGNIQLRCVSGIAAVHRSHVKQLPDVAAYDNYYAIVVDTGEIGVDQFATSTVLVGAISQSSLRR